MTGTPIQVHVRGPSIEFPSCCVCCAGSADRHWALAATKSKGKRVVRTETREINVPVCARCQAHAEAYAHSVLSVKVGGVLTLGATLLGATASGPVPLSALALGVCGGATFAGWYWAMHRAERAASPTCGSLATAASYDGWDGRVYTLTFYGREFARAFVTKNAPRIVNPSAEVRGLIQVQLDAELAAKNAAKTARMAELEADRFLEALRRIERARGPSGRKQALTLALEVTTTDTQRDELRTAAARAETRAALDKADSIQGLDAKVRALSAATEFVRGVAAPSRVTAELITELEAAIERARSRAFDISPAR